MKTSKGMRICWWMAAVSLGCGFMGCSTATQDAAWQEKRRAALNRPREVIYNNDGNEPVLWPAHEPFSIDTFLKMRTSPVAGSQVDTVFYCPISSGFGFLTANIPAADLKLRPVGGVAHLAAYTNVLQQFIDRGTDPVREVGLWCKTNNIEFFVSLRVNDTHDSGADQTRLGPPYDLSNWAFSPFKAQHPEMLMGSYTNRPPHCTWSAVDFTHEEVRERFFRICRDLCTHYDLDGLDLDFFRHLQLFRSVAWGGTASDAERDLLTAVMRRIRAAAEQEGKRRGRPILISIRVPDSVPYCRDVGIDLEAWLGEGLVDMVAGTGYWQFNPWPYMVELCRRHRVKFYASLDESRLPENADTPKRLSRNSVATYRGQAMAARQAGADGVMYFNIFNPAKVKSLMWGNPARMRLHDKCYHVTYRGNHKHARRYCKTADRYFSMAELSVNTPSKIAPGKSCSFPVWIGDNLPERMKENRPPVCELVIDATVPEGAVLTVSVNGQTAVAGKVEKNARSYALKPELLACGKNLLTFTVGGVTNANPVVVRDAAILITDFKNK